MRVLVKDFLEMAWDGRECVAIRNCETKDQKPEFMSILTALECWGEWVVEMFSVDPDIFGHSKCIHLWVYEK